ncbi:MAG: hypothetical protein MJ252_20585 [archaeon]|nr:hypothetical protein [archaeon]
MEKKSIYREHFPGYMGHIPYKYEVVGRTVGSSNAYIKSLLNKEPDYSQTFVPSVNQDYTMYNRKYFTDSTSKKYPLEEDKIFSNRSKEATTWICGAKHQIRPQHIPGYTGHVRGVNIEQSEKGSPLFGMSYAKATSVAIKDNSPDVPLKKNFYVTEMSDRMVRPKIRSDREEEQLRMEALKRNPDDGSDEIINIKKDPIYEGLSPAFIKAVGGDKKLVKDAPYILGYGGFRPGVISDNYYGKNFKTVSIQSINKRLMK